MENQKGGHRKILGAAHTKQIRGYGEQVPLRTEAGLQDRPLKEKAILTDPVDGMSYMPEKDHARTRFLLPNQLEALLDASQKSGIPKYMSSLILLGAEHGTCKQEALSLKWTDIDFEYLGRGLVNFYRTNRDDR